jgi:hypothetical protein
VQYGVTRGALSSKNTNPGAPALQTKHDAIHEPQPVVVCSSDMTNKKCWKPPASQRVPIVPDQLSPPDRHNTLQHSEYRSLAASTEVRLGKYLLDSVP